MRLHWGYFRELGQIPYISLVFVFLNANKCSLTDNYLILIVEIISLESISFKVF